MERIRSMCGLVPGILLLALIGLGGKFIEGTLAAYGKAHHLALPNIEYVLWAILIGLLISNTMGVHKIFKPGIATYEFFLKIGIVFLGSRFLLVDILKLGGTSLVLVAIEIVMSIAVMTFLGKRYDLPPKLTALLAIGTGICGVSAIIAAKGAIDAKKEDVSIAIAAILATGTISLFLLVPIGRLLGLDDQAFGVWAGLAVDNTAEAIATGTMFSDEAGRTAAFVKTARNATIGFVVLVYAWYYARQGLAQAVGNKGAFLWEKFPKFVLGFMIVSILASSGAFGTVQLSSLANLSRWAFLLTFAGVGLNTDFREMSKQGLRSFKVAVLGSLFITVLTCGLVVVAFAK